MNLSGVFFFFKYTRKSFQLNLVLVIVPKSEAL